MDNNFEKDEYDCNMFISNLINLLKSNNIKMIDYANAVGYKPQTIYTWRSKKQQPDWVDKAYKTFMFLDQIEYFEPMLLFKKDADINKYKKYENRIKEEWSHLQVQKKQMKDMSVLFTDYKKLRLDFDQQFIYLINKIKSSKELNNIEDKNKFRNDIGVQLYDCIEKALSKAFRF